MRQPFDPRQRVVVFIDGPNVQMTCLHLFGSGHVHPVFLAKPLLFGRTLAKIRYYGLVQDAEINPALRALQDRRHKLIARTGVEVIEREMRYTWKWGIADDLPEPTDYLGQDWQVIARPFRRGREKGLDLALALDVVRLAVTGAMDTAIILSADADLAETAKAVHELTDRRVKVEAAVFNRGHQSLVLEHYNYTHQLRLSDFEAAKDTFNYREDMDERWQEAFLISCRQASPSPAK